MGMGGNVVFIGTNPSIQHTNPHCMLSLDMEPEKLAFFVMVLLLFSTRFRPAETRLSEDKDFFSYKVDSMKGPKRWGLLDKRWAACNKGHLQSPINLVRSEMIIAPQLGKLRTAYNASPATMIDKGYEIMLKWENTSAGGIWLNGTEYALKQLHWHSPSEHTINNHRFSVELHMVHESASGKIAVVGVLYKIGHPDPFLAQMEKLLSLLKGGELYADLVDAGQARRGGRKYYRYLGSLTTPPCTEGVVWTIVTKVRTMSRQQIRLLRGSLDDDMDNNARPIQPANRRPIYYYRRGKARV